MNIYKLMSPLTNRRWVTLMQVGRLPLFACIAAIIASPSSTTYADTDHVGMVLPAGRADNMLEFVGVNADLNSNPDDPNSNYNYWTAALLSELKVRFIRQGMGWKGYTNDPAAQPPLYYEPYLDNAHKRQKTQHAYNNLGIRTLMGIGGIYSWAQPPGVDKVDDALIESQMRSIRDNYGAAVYAIEGQNEYAGSTNWGYYLRQYTERIAQKRSQLNMMNYGLVSATIVDWYNGYSGFQSAHNTFGNVYPWVNEANYHHYPNNHTTGNYSPGLEIGQRVRYIRDSNAYSGVNRRYVAITEFGTSSQSPVGSEVSQAKDMARYICEAERTGMVSKVFQFELMSPVGSHEEQFALVKAHQSNGNWAGFTKKPAFYAYKEFLALLNEATWNPTTKKFDRPNFTPQALPLDIYGVNENTKYRVFQKASGHFYLLMWKDVPSYNRASGTDIYPARDGVTIRVRTTSSVTWRFLEPYGNEGWAYNDRGFPGGGTDAQGYPYVWCGIPDYVVAVEIKVN